MIFGDHIADHVGHIGHMIIHIDLGLADDHGDDQDQTARWQLGDGPSHS